MFLFYYRINQNVSKILGIKRSLCPPYQPQTNGLKCLVILSRFFFVINVCLLVRSQKNKLSKLTPSK